MPHLLAGLVAHRNVALLPLANALVRERMRFTDLMQKGPGPRR